jgi:hypothetical protein
VRTDEILIDLVASLAFVENQLAGLGVGGMASCRYSGDHRNRQNPLAHSKFSFPFRLSGTLETLQLIAQRKEIGIYFLNQSRTECRTRPRDGARFISHRTHTRSGRFLTDYSAAAALAGPIRR